MRGTGAADPALGRRYQRAPTAEPGCAIRGGGRPGAAGRYGAPVHVLGEQEFEELVVDALDEIPEQLHALMDNVSIVIEDRHEDEDLLGLYEGVPLTEREDYGGLVMPDRITVYRVPLCEMCETPEEIVDEVRITVVHELAHHFGIDDDELHRLGWS